MEQSEVQEKCREFAELQKIKQQVTQRHAELQQEIFYLADREEACLLYTSDAADE